MLIETGCAAGVCLPLSDHAMFKGATMRHLGYLRRFDEGGCKGSGSCMRRVARLRDFADTNAESCWWHAREERLLYQRSGAPRTRQLFDNDWRGPYAVDSTGEIDSSLCLVPLNLVGAHITGLACSRDVADRRPGLIRVAAGRRCGLGTTGCAPAPATIACGWAAEGTGLGGAAACLRGCGGGRGCVLPAEAGRGCGGGAARWRRPERSRCRRWHLARPAAAAALTSEGNGGELLAMHSASIAHTGQWVHTGLARITALRRRGARQTVPRSTRTQPSSPPAGSRGHPPGTTPR